FSPFNVIRVMQANFSTSRGHVAEASVGVVVASPDELDELDELELDELESEPVATDLGLSLPPKTMKPTTAATATAAATSTKASARLPRRDGIATPCGSAGSQLGGATAAGGGGGGAGGGGSAG